MSVDRRALMLGAAAASAVAGATALGFPAGPARAAATRRGAEDTGPVPTPVPEQVKATEGMAPVGDARLWYWDTGGSGAPIVLFHPFTGSGRVWSYQQPVFARAGYRVIGYSRRGFERSESGPKDKPGTGSADLHALLDFLKVDRFHAVSTAGGAFVAADYALSHPERLQSLVLACSILGASGGEFAKMSSGLRPPGFNEMPEHFKELSPSYRAADLEGTERWKQLQSTSTTPESRVQQIYANKITLDRLPELKMPTLLLAGGADLIAPPPIVRLFAKYIPGSELVVIPEAGHSAYWERPELFNRAVLDFTGRHRGRK